MAKLMARAGRGLSYKLGSGRNVSRDESGSEEEDEDEVEDEKPFEPLCVWVSPEEGGEAKGLPCFRLVYGWFVVGCFIFCVVC